MMNTKSSVLNDQGDTYKLSNKSADKPKPPGICLAREEEVMIDGGRNCIRWQLLLPVNFQLLYPVNFATSLSC